MATRSSSSLKRSLLGSVVRVLTVSDDPDYEQPWQTRGPSTSMGSGAIIPTSRGHRVLTNGHVVQNQVFLEVTRHGLSKKYPAEVEAVGHDCDLAVLKVEDREFFRGTRPIPIGRLPNLSQTVSVLGYPIGGDRISITQGVLSRIEITHYAQSQRRLLAGQLDAAINAGNSGGPVVRNDKLVGVAFQALEDADNIGYMIAEPVVRHFLQDLENGSVDGFPDLGVVTQTLESAAQRRVLGLKLRSGVLVAGVAYQSTAWKVLQRGDVLLSIDGVKIANDGTVPFLRGSRIDFPYLISQKHVGQAVDLTVLRAARTERLKAVLKPPQYLVPEDRYDVKPSYYLFAGLLFVPLTRDFLKTWGPHWWYHAPHALMAHYENHLPTARRQEVVVLQKVLADKVNLGYHHVESTEITHVQGRPVRCLRELVRMVEEAKEEFISFSTIDGFEIVLDRVQGVMRTHIIMRRYGVPRDRSADLDRPAPRPASG